MIKQFCIQIVVIFSTLIHAFGQAPAKNKKAGPDTTFNVFGDKNYFVTFKTLTTQDDEDFHFGALTLIHNLNGKNEILFQDTLEFFMPLLQLKDFNNDKTKDILILNTSSARSVWTHYLYIVDNANHQLHRVFGFEEINNPDLDSKNNVITSTSIYSQIYYQFYRINKNYELINLGNSFAIDPANQDSLKYSNAIKNINNGIGLPDRD